MTAYLLLIVILLPIIGGSLVPLIRFKKRIYMEVFLETIVVVNSILVLILLFLQPNASFTVINFTGNLSITFQVDGLTTVFAGLIAILWPFATLYACEYMKHEGHEKIFFFFYTATFGVTLGISLAANVITMYFFYELLTLVTVPLVMHTLSREAIVASRKYLYYSLGGAAFAFIGVIFIIIYGETSNFVLGGVMGTIVDQEIQNKLLLVYVFSFFGFGVKAAIFPFNSWLPQAGVAPTPVTALLHAVAVVKSGAFSIMRITYYSFFAEFLKGTWAQNVVMVFVIFTIIYGCSMAVKETHLKRRLAYSTISNLSYILFGVVIMTPLGLVGALCHMVFHAFMKICSFFCAGSIIYQTGKTYVHQLNGLAKKMPKVFAIFTISAFALMGVPGLCGFISKYQLATAAVESKNTLAYLGIVALLLSALLTAIYMLTIVIRAYFPGKDFNDQTLEGITDPNWVMLVPLCFFTIGIIVFGLYSQPIITLFYEIATGIF